MRGADQSQVYFVHQRRGLERVSGMFLPQMCSSQVPQFVVDDGGEPPKHLFAAHPLRFLEDGRDLVAARSLSVHGVRR